MAAVRAVIDIGLCDLGLHRLENRAAVVNARSRTIPERLGFTQEAILHHAGRGSGAHGFHDMVVYGLLEDGWPPT
jgi:ribosomal-protein-serine acetyltransferase